MGCSSEVGISNANRSAPSASPVHRCRDKRGGPAHAAPPKIVFAAFFRLRRSRSGSTLRFSKPSVRGWNQGCRQSLGASALVAEVAASSSISSMIHYSMRRPTLASRSWRQEMALRLLHKAVPSASCLISFLGAPVDPGICVRLAPQRRFSSYLKSKPTRSKLFLPRRASP